MNIEIPFLKPSLVRKEHYLHYLEQIDETRLYSNYGPLNQLFESRILRERFRGQGAAVTVCNATCGLMLAISQNRRATGRYALMPSFTFAATPLAALWCGLEPYFIDVRPGDWCLDEVLLAETIAALGDEVAIVIPYATFGSAMKLDFYEELHRSGVPVVVDAAPCFGTVSEEGQFGQGFPGSVVFSFHATKAFGIGEGGLVYSGDEATIERIRQAANFGFSERREAVIVGLNGKLSEYTAAVALATLDAFPEKCQRRQEVYRCYRDAFSAHGLSERGWSLQDERGSIPHQFFPTLCPDREDNAAVLRRLEKVGVQARTYFSPACHQQVSFRQYPRTTMEVIEGLSRRIVSLPLWEEMGCAEVEQVVRGIAG